MKLYFGIFVISLLLLLCRPIVGQDNETDSFDSSEFVETDSSEFSDSTELTDSTDPSNPTTGFAFTTSSSSSTSTSSFPSSSTSSQSTSSSSLSSTPSTGTSSTTGVEIPLGDCSQLALHSHSCGALICNSRNTFRSNMMTVPPDENAKADTIPSPSKMLILTIRGLTGPFSPELEDIPRLHLSVDSRSAESQGINAQIAFDFEGDDVWDRRETFQFFAMDDLSGWETWDGTVEKVVGQNYRDMTGGTVQLELWSALPSTEVIYVHSDAPDAGTSSWIQIPFIIDEWEGDLENSCATTGVPTTGGQTPTLTASDPKFSFSTKLIPSMLLIVLVVLIVF